MPTSVDKENYDSIIASRLNFLSRSEIDTLFEKNMFKITKVGKGSHILEKGRICRNINLILEGSVRQFAIKQGEEINFLFYFVDDFMFDELSFYEKTPSKYFFQTLEETHLLQIDNSVFDTYKNDSRWTRFLFGLSKKNVVRLYKRNEVLLLENAEERYLKLIEIHPKIIEKISLAKIASFIGIAPPSLSRIRKRLVKGSIS